VVTANGLRAIDAGALRRGREPEALGFLQITLAAQQKMPSSGGFAVAA
jgi:8-hydroxy-5-deazaflavin:NADPH oxidoreductase